MSPGTSLQVYGRLCGIQSLILEHSSTVIFTDSGSTCNAASGNYEIASVTVRSSATLQGTSSSTITLCLYFPPFLTASFADIQVEGAIRVNVGGMLSSVHSTGFTIYEPASGKKKIYVAMTWLLANLVFFFMQQKTRIVFPLETLPQWRLYMVSFALLS